MWPSSPLFVSLFLFLFLRDGFALTEGSNLNYCTRIAGKTRFLSFWVGGLRADILEEYLYLLPNFQRLANAGVNASCPTFSSFSCARSSLGNRYAPNPIDYRKLGAFNITDTESEADYLSTYHWSTFSGFASIATGFDTPFLKVRGGFSNDGELFFNALSGTSGTFLLQARDHGLVTAVTGCSPVLTSSWNSLEIPFVQNITPGVLDYECGVDSNGLPSVDPLASSSCNMDYRRAVTEAEFLASSDEIGADFVKTLVSRGCAHIHVYHINALQHAMHSYGIGSVEYIQALISTDALIGSVLDVLEHNAEVYGYNYLVITTSDHGGAEIGIAPYIDIPEQGIFRRIDHGSNWLRDEVVPFIISTFGPSPVPLRPLSIVHNYDLTPTVLEYFEIPISDDLNGIVQGIPTNDSFSIYHNIMTSLYITAFVMILILQ
jgi:hypothetical protein